MVYRTVRTVPRLALATPPLGAEPWQDVIETLGTSTSQISCLSLQTRNLEFLSRSQDVYLSVAINRFLLQDKKNRAYVMRIEVMSGRRTMCWQAL